MAPKGETYHPRWRRTNPAVEPRGLRRKGNLAAELSASPDNANQGNGDPEGTKDEGFVLPGPGATRSASPRLRRRLLGLRAGDVKAEIGARDSEIAELKRDIAALWLAFGQHERTIQEVLKALERTGGGPIAPPGGRAAEAGQPSATQSRPGTEPGSGSLAQQLSGLDEVLGAIEEATRTLERNYAEEIEDDREDQAAEAEPDGSEGEKGKPASDD